MKKLNLIVLVALGLLFVAQAGFSQRPIFVMGGIQETWINGGSSWDAPSTHAQFGVGMPFADLSNQISFRGELNVSMQGSHWDEGEGNTGHTNLAYLNLPLVLRYLWSSGLFGELGIQPGYCIGAKDHWSGGSANFIDEVNKFDFGIPVGIGYELKGPLGLGLRYIYGITKINSHGSESVHNAVLALRLTYTFHKNKK